MYYENKRNTMASVIQKRIDEGVGIEDMSMMLAGVIVEALYDIADELHEINKNVRAGLDDGR